MLTLIEHGDLYTPAPAGEGSLLIAGETVLAVGAIDATAVASLGVPLRRIDAAGRIVCPGFIDPHEHIIGGAGEDGFGTRTSEVTVEEIVTSGVTTVVGLLGTDTISRHLTSLLAKARQLEDDGMSAWIYTGGFPVPTPTITGSVQRDLVIVDKVIGVGEIAIADDRSAEPTLQELARLVSDAIVGGRVGGKSGVTHFHVGPSDRRLALLKDLLDQHDIPPEYLYATHINRSPALIADSARLARRGAFVDTDTIDENVGETVRAYVEHGGPLEQLTISSDARTHGGTVAKLHAQLVSCVRQHGMSLEEALPLLTTNTARALKLARKGRLAAGMDADVTVLDSTTLEVVHVVARGRHLVRDGAYAPDLESDAAENAALIAS